MSGSEPAPSPPNVALVASASAHVFTGDVCQVTQALTSSVMLPIQLNLRPSNSPLSISGPRGRPPAPTARCPADLRRPPSPPPGPLRPPFWCTPPALAHDIIGPREHVIFRLASLRPGR